MKVMITGGTGSVGNAIREKLLAQGDQVLIIGRRESVDTGEAEYRQCDINDFDSLLEASKGVDGIIHLAAIPSPGAYGSPPEELMRINVSGTFNVFQAAARNGIKRVSAASSINAFGFNYGIRPFKLAYFPIDEETPGETTDEYSFSKNLTEQIAQYHWRRNGISSVSIRIPWVYHAKEEVFDRFRQGRRRFAEDFERYREWGPEKTAEEVARALETHNHFRAHRYDPDFKHPTREERQRMYPPYFFGRTDFYTVIDERDCAQGFIKGLKADYDGAHTLYINDSHNFTGIPSRVLAETLYPRPECWTGEWKKELEGTESLVSIDKARELIGFEPEHGVETIES